MALTDDPYLVSSAIYDLFVAHKVALGLKGVYFGNIALIPETPSLMVDPGRVATTRAGAMNKMHHDFTTFLLVYHSPIDDREESVRELMQYAQAIKQVYETSKTTRLLGDPSVGANLLLDGYVSVQEPGFTIRQNSMVRTSRLTLFGMSETLMLN